MADIPIPRAKPLVLLKVNMFPYLNLFYSFQTRTQVNCLNSSHLTSWTNQLIENVNDTIKATDMSHSYYQCLLVEDSRERVKCPTFI